MISEFDLILVLLIYTLENVWQVICFSIAAMCQIKSQPFKRLTKLKSVTQVSFELTLTYMTTRRARCYKLNYLLKKQ